MLFEITFKKRTLITFVLIQTLSSLLILVPASTASTSSYYLDKSRLEITVSPTSQTASGMVKVSSNSNSQVRLKVIPKLWQLSPDGIVKYIDPPAQGFNLLDNIGINPEEFELQPGKSRLVRFLVKTPEDVKEAEYPFQLYFQPSLQLQGNAKKSASGVSNSIELIPIFTTTVYIYQGNPTPKTQVKSFQCAYKADKNQIGVNLNLENQGLKHSRLFGNVILLKKTLSTPLEVFHLQNSMLIIVFPHPERVVQEQLAVSKKLEPGDYQLELQLVDERNLQPAIRSTCDISITAGTK